MDHSNQHNIKAFLNDVLDFRVTNQAGSPSSAHNNGLSSPYLNASSSSFPVFDAPAPNSVNHRGVLQNTTTYSSLSPTPPMFAVQADLDNDFPPAFSFSFPEYPEPFDFSVNDTLLPGGYDFEPPTEQIVPFSRPDFLNAISKSDQTIQLGMPHSNTSPSLNNLYVLQSPIALSSAQDPSDHSSYTSSYGDGGNSSGVDWNCAMSVSSGSNQNQLENLVWNDPQNEHFITGDAHNNLANNLGGNSMMDFEDVPKVVNITHSDDSLLNMRTTAIPLKNQTLDVLMNTTYTDLSPAELASLVDHVHEVYIILSPSSDPSLTCIFADASPR